MNSILLGLIRDQSVTKTQEEQLLEIQDRLFTMGSLLATDPKGTKMKLPQLKDSDIENLENWIDEMEETLEPMTSFVLPGGHTTVSFCHIARCVCRRAERIVVDLNENEKNRLNYPDLLKPSQRLYVCNEQKAFTRFKSE